MKTPFMDPLQSWSNGCPDLTAMEAAGAPEHRAQLVEAMEATIL